MPHPAKNIQPAVLLLEDGSIYRGKAFGKIGTAAGEICFNTGMTGYQEVFTDPSYAGQVLVMNNCYIGNYGTRSGEVESESIKIKGLICKNIAYNYSRVQADLSLEQYLAGNGLVAIYDIDTRALVTHIRSKGAMNCIISSEIMEVDRLREELTKIPSMAGLELSSRICTQKMYPVGNPDAPVKIAVLDCGVKKNILHCLAERGAYLQVYPAKTSFAEMEKFHPDGYFVSNGPGDPAAMEYGVQTVKDILAADKP
ncbi:MAG TPA: carbamoyl phosphate synthase small subunit, partial [Chitinophagaceae bacterium]